MPLTEHQTNVTLEEIVEKGEGMPCSSENGARDIVVSKLKERFPDGAKKILLINPPMTTKENFDLNLARTQSYPCYPPYGIAILSTQLEKRGYGTKIVDLNFELLRKANTNSPGQFNYDVVWQERLNDVFDNFQPDLIGVTCMYTMIHPSMDAVVEYIRNNKGIKTPLIAGGAHPALAAEDVLQKSPDIDFVSLFESDNSFPTLVDFINGKAEKNRLTQIAIVINGKVVSLTERSTPSPDEINVRPNYQDLPIGNYTDYGKIGVYSYLRGDNIQCTTILKSRGCRAKCSFCSVREFNGIGVRHRPADDVVDEMEWLRDNYGIQHFVWLDDDLLNDKKRTMETFNKMIDRNLGITWDASNGVIAAALDEENAEAAEKSGCIGMSFGIESGNEQILRRIHKPATIERFYRAAEILDNHPDIFTKGFLIIGFPDDGQYPAETIGQIWDTIRLSQKMRFDWYTVQLCMPLPGTELAKNIEKTGKKSVDITREAMNRFQTGFGLQSKLAKEYRDRSSGNFEEILLGDPNYAPTREELKNVRFFVEFYVNYEDYKDPTKRTKANKLSMQERNLIEVVQRKDPENPIAHLYLSILRDRLGMSEGAAKARRAVHKHLDNSVFYHDRFKYLRLNELLEQAERGDFRKENYERAHKEL